VITDSSGPHEADFCVCAIPAHCMVDIEWNPRPNEKLEAANELQYARITKTAVLCSYRFWPQPRKGGFSVCTSLASDFVFDSTYGQKGSTKRILCSYAVGDKADDIASAPLDKLKDWIAEDVANSQDLHWTAADSARPAIDIAQQPWQADRFTRGAYAFYRPGQWFTVMPKLKKRFGRVYFAGEHIAEWQGFMEGAVETGYKAADDILKVRRR
jgi:monoamine oxidase